MVTPILERDDKSRKLLKDYQDAATQTARMKALNARIAHDRQQNPAGYSLRSYPKGTLHDK